MGVRAAPGPAREVIAVAAIDVTPADAAGVYDVQLDTGGEPSHHRVTVPSEPSQAGLPDAEPERLVRESMAFLLEREPPGAILAEFELPLIARYFPEYPEELHRRLG